MDPVLASAAVIAVAGTRPARQGDRISVLTGLGRLWIGFVLAAEDKALSEVLTDVSAAQGRKLPSCTSLGRQTIVPPVAGDESSEVP